MRTYNGFAALAFSAIADALNATGRLHDAFMAEILAETQVTNVDLNVAVEVEAADFTWDNPPSDVQEHKKKDKKSVRKTQLQSPAMPISVGNEADIKDDRVFQLKNVNMKIPRGALCAIVGPVGSGKSSLLQGLIGEMRRTAGTVTFGGSVGYCPQSAWIQVRLNSHLRIWLISMM